MIQHSEYFLTLPELAARWKLHPQSIRNRLSKTKDFPIKPVKLAGNAWRFRMSDVLAHEAEDASPNRGVGK